MANFKELKKCQRKINHVIKDINKMIAADSMFNNIHVDFLSREYYYKKCSSTEDYIPRYGLDFTILITNDYNGIHWALTLPFEAKKAKEEENIKKEILNEVRWYAREWMSDYIEHLYQSKSEDEWNALCDSSIVYQRPVNKNE